MFIILVGYPGAGKSTFADLIKSNDESVDIMRPSDWYPNNIEEMPSKAQMDYKIACWEHAIDKTSNWLGSNSPSSVVILDTCGASAKSLTTLFAMAALHKHKTICMIVHTPMSICASRSDPGVVQKYTNKLKVAIPEYKEKCDEIIVVRYDSLDKWQELSNELCRKILAPQNNQKPAGTNQ